jgi:hypothetical protein
MHSLCRWALEIVIGFKKALEAVDLYAGESVLRSDKNPGRDNIEIFITRNPTYACYNHCLPHVE